MNYVSIQYVDTVCRTVCFLKTAPSATRVLYIYSRYGVLK